MPNNAKSKIYKAKEYQIYVLWKSLPAYFRGLKKEQLFSYGFTDPLSIKIASIKSQTEFAKKFRIKDLGTLTDWNAKIKREKREPDLFYSNIQKHIRNANESLAKHPNISQQIELSELRERALTLEKENKELRKQLDKLVSAQQTVKLPEDESHGILRKALSFIKMTKGK